MEFLSLTPVGKSLLRKKKLGQLFVNDMYVLPFSLRNSYVERINQIYVKRRLSTRKYNVIVLTNPMQYKFIPERHLDGSTLIYECMDNIPFFYTGSLRERFLYEESKLIKVVDGIIVSSDYLNRKIKQQLGDVAKPICTIYNAIDPVAFINRTRQIIKLRKPNMVYIGTIGSWIDWDVVEKFSVEHPNYTIYMVGPVEYRRKLPSNVVFTGSIPHEQVPDYITSGDKMLIPFIRNELIEAVDPVKLYEYVSLGKPVICAYWPELDRFGDYVNFYHNFDDFKKYALQAVNNNCCRVNMEFINMHNWSVRTKEYISYVTQLVDSKSQRN